MIATPMLYLLCLHYTMYTLDLLCEVEFHRVQVYSVYSPWVTDYNVLLKVIMQGKLFHWCTHLLFCSVLSIGGKVNTRRMSKSDMGSIFYIKKPMKYSGHRKLLVNYLLYEYWCIYSCLQISPRENWFQYVRRVYTTAINFPCIITLVLQYLAGRQKKDCLNIRKYCFYKGIRAYWNVFIES